MKLTKTLIEDIRALIRSARATVARGVDLVQVHTNFEIGRRIVEQEQRGKGRADYGGRIIKAPAQRLTEEFGKGFSPTNLKLMRLFYLQNRNRIGPTVFGQLEPVAKGQTLFDQSLLLQPAVAELHSPEYRLYLPSKAELKRKLLEWADNAGEDLTIGEAP